MKKQKTSKYITGKNFFITLVSIYILCVIYGLARNFFYYYMEDGNILIPNASGEEQLRNKGIYINGDFILDLYSYRELFEKDFGKPGPVGAIFNKQYLEYGNYIPEKQLILKMKEPSYLGIFDLQYLTHTFFKKKFVTSSSHIEIFKTKNKNGNRNIKKINNKPNGIKTLKKYPNRICDDGICTLKGKDGSEYTIPTYKYDVSYTGYSMTGDTFVLDIPRTQYIEEDIEYCESFVRPDCIIFNSFIKKPKSFYYDIFVDWEKVQPGDTLSIISK